MKKELLNKPYKIIPTKVMVYTESETKLDWWKELVCKIFKINPQRHTYYFALVYYSENMRFYKGDILFAPHDSTRWLVTECHGGRLEIKNVTPISHEIADIRELVLLSSSYAKPSYDKIN